MKTVFKNLIIKKSFLCICVVLSTACSSSIAVQGGSSQTVIVTPVSGTVTSTLPVETPSTTSTVTPSGCSHPSPVAPGTTARETLPVDPSVNAGASTRSYLLH